MTTNNDPDAIRANIEQTRSELSDNVDALADTANPKHIASRQADKVKGAVRGVQEKIMGSPDDDDNGTVGDAKTAVGQKVSDVGDAVSGLGDAASAAPARAKEKTRGNPLAAGVVAFGTGMLISSLFPATQKEQQAVATLQDNLEPMKEQASGIARDLVENLKGPAQDAAEAVRDTASEAAENVKGEAVDAKDQVQDQTAQSKDAVQSHQSSSN